MRESLKPAESARPLTARIEAITPEPGLYLVSTPIGTARDITLRALDLLNSADVLAAEDTRTLRHLMDIHGIPVRGRRIIAYHDHNADKARPGVLKLLAEGLSVAYASEAGTPLVADPGFRLGRDAAEAGVRVFAAPGASAVLAALTVSGLPSDRFLFLGFPPATNAARAKWLAEWAKTDATVIFFESPRRVKQTLGNLCETEGERGMVICRELTKRFEEVMRGTVAELHAAIPDDGLKGEVVMLLDRPGAVAVDDDAVRAALASALERLKVKDAAGEVAAKLGLSKRDVYQIALSMRD